MARETLVRETAKKPRVTIKVVRVAAQMREAVHSTTIVQTLHKAGLYEGMMKINTSEFATRY